jgi:hypothetical protein
MKRRVTRISLVIAICSLILALPVSFFRYTNLSTLPPFSLVLYFENSDQDEPLKDYDHGSDSFLSGVIQVKVPSEANYFTGIRYVFFLPAFLGQGTFTLRC